MRVRVFLHFLSVSLPLSISIFFMSAFDGDQIQSIAGFYFSQRNEEHQFIGS